MTTQAARKTNNSVIDLDSLLYQRSTKPATVRLGGRDFTMRRDLSAEEVVKYWAHVAKNEDAKAFALLVGEEEGETFNTMLRNVPADIYIYAYAQLMDAAGMKIKPPAKDDGSEGDGDAGES